MDIPVTPETVVEIDTVKKHRFHFCPKTIAVAAAGIIAAVGAVVLKVRSGNDSSDEFDPSADSFYTDHSLTPTQE